MRIVLSHASEQHKLAAQLATALREQGHRVFVDRDDLPPGRSFHDRIRGAIEHSDYFIFLISPDSVRAGKYTNNELEFARKRWRSPGGYVLPVLVAPTPMEDIDPYLRAILLHEPKGDLIAAVLAVTAEHSRRKPSPALLALAAVPVLVVMALILYFSGGDPSRLVDVPMCAPYSALKRPAWRERYLQEASLAQREDWRSRYASAIPLYYVIVTSADTTQTVEEAELSTRKLRDRFPTLDFDTILTARIDGQNQRWAVVMASRLREKRVACDARKVGLLCAVLEGTYVYLIPGQNQPGRVVSDC